MVTDKRIKYDTKISFAESLNDLIYFKHYPENIIVENGFYYIDTRIGVLPNVTKGEYPIYFDIAR